MKKRLVMRRKKYPEVRGKVVDYITHSVDNATVYFTVWFKDKTAFSLRYACDLFIAGADFSDWKDGRRLHSSPVHEAHSKVEIQAHHRHADIR